MPYVRVVGEDHRSDVDQREQSNIDFVDFDAVFKEHHDEKKGSLQRFSTALGLPYFATFRIYRTVTESFYHDHTETIQERRDLEIGVEKNIDLGPIETYQAIGTTVKIVIPLISILSGAIIGLWVQFLFPSFGTELPIPPGEILGTVALTGVFLLMNHGLTETAGSFAREKHMVEEIDRRSENQGYDNVVVICGDHHRPIIGFLLEQKGWNSEEQPSKSGFAKSFGFIRVVRLFALKLFY